MAAGASRAGPGGAGLEGEPGPSALTRLQALQLEAARNTENPFAVFPLADVFSWRGAGGREGELAREEESRAGRRAAGRFLVLLAWSGAGLHCLLQGGASCGVRDPPSRQEQFPYL